MGHHYFTFQALDAAGAEFTKAATYLDAARSKRNDFSYDAPIAVSDTDADDLVNAVIQFRIDAERWIASHYPSLV